VRYIIFQAYSNYDEEVGYCQGLSFITATFLLHVRFNLLSLSLRFLFFFFSLSSVWALETCFFLRIWAKLNSNVQNVNKLQQTHYLKEICFVNFPAKHNVPSPMGLNRDSYGKVFLYSIRKISP